MRLIIIFGPPAVGKMTVGEALAAKTGFALFHNHVTIEPLLRFFPFDSPPFLRLNRMLREELFAEIAASDHKGLIFTYVWALDIAEDKTEVEKYIARFTSDPADVCFVELAAPQDVRLARNRTARRLDQKPSKRDLAWSDANLVESDAKYVLNSNEEWPFFYPDRHLKLESALLEPEAAARQIVRHFGLEAP